MKAFLSCHEEWQGLWFGWLVMCVGDDWQGVCFCGCWVWLVVGFIVFGRRRRRFFLKTKKAFLEAFRASWGALSTENGLSAPRSSSGWIFRASRGGFGEIPPAPENPSFMTIGSRVHDNSGNLQPGPKMQRVDPKVSSWVAPIIVMKNSQLYSSVNSS